MLGEFSIIYRVSCKQPGKSSLCRVDLRYSPSNPEIRSLAELPPSPALVFGQHRFVAGAKANALHPVVARHFAQQLVKSGTSTGEGGISLLGISQSVLLMKPPQEFSIEREIHE